MKAARSEVNKLFQLAVPLMLTNLGMMLMGVVDTAMVGRLGASELAGVSVGNGIFFVVGVLGIGLVTGMDPLVSQALGAGEKETARSAYWQSLYLAGLVSVPCSLGILAVGWWIGFAGVDGATSAEVWAYLLGRVPSLLPMLVYYALRGYLQAKEVARPIVVAMVIGNVVNFLANGVLIFDAPRWQALGLPGLGLGLGTLGAGLASSLSTVAMLAVLMWVMRTVHREEGQESRAWAPFDGALVRRIVALGLPIGGQQCLEVAIFALVSILAARISAVAGSGHQVAVSLVSSTFMMATGMGQATSVRVGLAVGGARPVEARARGVMGIVSGTSLMILAGIMFLLFPSQLARVLSDKSEIVTAALPLIQVAAAFQICDGIQAITAGALRGAGDTKTAFWSNAFAHYAIGLPLGAYLAFGRSLGAVGLWWGLCAGVVVVSLLLTVRFQRLARTGLARA